MASEDSKLLPLKNYQRGEAWMKAHGKVTVPACHPDKKLYATGLCKPCYDKRRRELRRGNSRDIDRRKYYKKRYGLTLDQVAALKAAATVSGCQICGEFNGRNDGLHIDHCHATGRIRGVLCMKCNFLVGHIEKNTQKVHGIMSYLGMR